MCGIFGYVGKRSNAAQIVFEGLKCLEYRGYDSWGVAVVPTVGSNIKNQISKTSNRIIVKKRIGKIGGAAVNELPASHFGFGHTRWATHGGVTEKNAHPHLNEEKTIAIVHNGIIENYTELKQHLLKKKHSFSSETDSEISAHLIEDYGKRNDFPEAVRKAFVDLHGLNALISFSAKENRLVGIRNGSPLVVGFGKGENFIASDASALLPHTRQVYYLEDDEMVVIKDKSVALFDAKTGKRKNLKKQTLKWKQESDRLGSFKHYMLKEIHEQPAVLSRIVKEDLVQAKRLASEMEKSYGTYFVGCGTAAYACMAGSYLFSAIAQRHVNWAVASEFGFQLEFLTKKSFVTAISQSGETMDTIEAIKKSRAKGARIGGLINVEGSTLHRTADVPLGLHAGIEKGVCSTKAFASMISHLILAAYACSHKLDEGVFLIKQAAESSKKLLQKDSIDRLKFLAKKIQHNEHIFVVGRGLSYPTSLEAALKIKEISYIHAEGFAAGELKHGVIALIEKGTPCMVFAPSDETYFENIAGAMEMKARGGYIIGVSEKNHEVFDYHIPVKQAGIATIIPNVVAAQLLAYYLTLEKGFDPDKPRNLAKSVTVK